MKSFELRLVAWEMTRACNLNCIHCRAGACPQADPNQLSTLEGFRLIDGIRAVGKPILIMTGGEPLLRPDFFDLANYAVKSGLRAVLATNGVLVTEAIAKELAKVGIPRASISLDGASAEDHDKFRKIPGAFEASLKGVEALKSAGIGVQINTTLTKRNRDQLSQIMKLAEKIGAVAFHVFLLVPTGRAKDMSGEEMGPEEYEETLLEFYSLGRKSKLETKATCAPQYYRIMRQQAAIDGLTVDEVNFGLNARTRGCLGGLSFCFISHIGELQPCGYFDVQAGSIRDTSFADLWANAELFKDLRTFSKLEGKCGKCNYLRFCGGCRARAYENSGSYMAEEPYCAYKPPSHMNAGRNT
ncbi:MAG: heme b synthase [Desulfomonilaceae bacterium]